MDSIRKRIFKNFEAAGKAVASLKSFGFGTFEPNNQHRPAGGFAPSEENTETDPDDISIERLNITTRIVVKEGSEEAGYELEDVLSDFHRAVMADPSRGGVAMNTRKTATRWLFLDQEFPKAGAEIDHEIIYQTAERDPNV